MGGDSEVVEDDDDEILMAASAWASAHEHKLISSNTGGAKNEGHGNTKKCTTIIDKEKSISLRRDDDNSSRSRTKALENLLITKTNTTTSYSLHLTNVPYDISQSDIRREFLDRKCNVASVRLVYDRDQKTGEKHFRGVAFVDLADEESYARSLSELHNKAFLGKGRRVSVRPTRSKSELSDIVRRTEEKVAKLIARSKEQKQSNGDESEAVVISHGDKDGSRSTKDKKRNKKKRKNDKNSLATVDTSDYKKQKIAAALNTTTDEKISENGDRSDVMLRVTKPTLSQRKEEDGIERCSSPKSKRKKNDTNDGATQPKHGRTMKRSLEGSTPVKLTKKQRARKAAVLRMLKTRGK